MKKSTRNIIYVGWLILLICAITFSSNMAANASIDQILARGNESAKHTISFMLFNVTTCILIVKFVAWMYFGLSFLDGLKIKRGKQIYKSEHFSIHQNQREASPTIYDVDSFDQFKIK